jgi:hypothetical protein
MRILSDKFAQKFKKLILCSITLFFFETRVVYQIMWENNVERDRPRVTIWHMRIACWTLIANRTHSEIVILTAFRQLQWLHERAKSYVIHALPVLLLVTITQTKHHY